MVDSLAARPAAAVLRGLAVHKEVPAEAVPAAALEAVGLAVGAAVVEASADREGDRGSVVRRRVDSSETGGVRSRFAAKRHSLCRTRR